MTENTESTRVQVVTTHDVRNRLTEIAKSRGLGISALLRGVIIEWLEHYDRAADTTTDANLGRRPTTDSIWD